ncbi:SGNH/GDSL hydrolase family protein [Larkinella terrae]|uniref:SGNH/GDSL hydrolase family protein n=1 Tax=Larkinella terrae TaxID=2025311 RepID=A0A7K0ESM4_9BACT|nr:SGNH/GDSL hydrolase family protein [Larkinella terrae]MRS64418.1 SGNH/GDSL hydrolase family protein [Larkinella terrae]
MKNALLIALFLGFSFTLKAQVADSEMYLSDLKKELIIEWPKNRTINLVFHGHSVPAGYWENHEVHTLESYPNLVLTKLKEKYPYAVINVIVTAIGGENSIKGQERFEKDVLVHKPDVLFIDYALNDRGAGLEKAKEAWDKMIQSALSKNIKVILLTPSPDQRVDIKVAGNDLELHTNQIIKLAETNHIGLVDSYAQFNKIATRGDLVKYMASVNHPNLAGHQLIANELIKWFTK